MPRANAVALELEHRLAQDGEPARAVSAKKYLKSDLEFLGTSMPAIRRIAQAFTREQPGLDHAALWAVASALWRRPIFECKALAVAILERRVKLLGAADLGHLERMTRESHTWALSDWIAIHLVGPILRKNPDGRLLDRWAKDDDYWVQRMALICQRDDFSEGQGDWPRFTRHAAALLVERPDASKEERFFLRKAIGWMLRTRGEAKPEDVVAFVAKHRDNMSGLTLREATRKLDPDNRRRALGEA